ncbi:MAG: metallophosphoesterase [Bacteroidales bacterium]|nr:metallophosphoesterase [Bacteroidales bacterium]
MLSRLSLASLIFLCMSTGRLQAQTDQPQDFNFIFMTDIHLEPGRRAPEGFRQAIDTANKLNADFVLTGGDLVADALGASHGRADSLYLLYRDGLKAFTMPVYNTIGNHELWGIYRSSGADTTHPDYGYGMYRRYFGDTYYSFDHKGWHFIILNSITDAGDRYLGYIDSTQLEWIKHDLEQIEVGTPVILCTHIPLISAYNQLSKGSTAPNDSSMVVSNSRDVLLMLYRHNLKLVLQGHHHIIEALSFQNKVTFLTGGAVSAYWWGGPREGMEEGFMLIKLRNGEVDWEYVDFGWEAGGH